jgi:hypothetical protein
MPTKPKSDVASVVADSRRVLLAARKYVAQLRAAEKGRKAKLFPGGVDAFLTSLGKSVAAVEQQAGAQVVRGKSMKGATASEKDARASLFDSLVTIRDAVGLTPGVAPVVAQAFGHGMKIKATSTPVLLTTANALIEAYGDPANRKVAAAAGITPALVKKCSAARDALAGADAAQGGQQSARKIGTQGKNAVVASLTKGVTHIRKVAKSVFRRDAAALTAFASTLPRHTVKKRAAKKTSAPGAAAPTTST